MPSSHTDGRKTTRAEVALRVDAILRIKLDGAQYHDILDYAREQGWDVCTRTLHRYCRQADALLAARLEKDRDRLFAKALAQREALFARAVNAGDFSTAARILADRDKLLNLYPQEKGASGRSPADPWADALRGASKEQLTRLLQAWGPVEQVQLERVTVNMGEPRHDDETARVAAAGDHPEGNGPPGLPDVRGSHVDPVGDGRPVGGLDSIPVVAGPDGSGEGVPGQPPPRGPEG
jgi:hypothetical protein